MKKEIKDLLIAINLTEHIFKYPIGNKELTEKIKLYESQNLIKFDQITYKWVKA